MSPSAIPALDVESIVAPIPGALPAGVDIRYHDELGTYDKIKAARRLAIERQEGRAGLASAYDNQSPEERAASAGESWLEVRRMIVDALTRQSKDLQLGAWLLEAQTFIGAFSGAATALDILRRLIERSWDVLLPPVDPDDEEPLALRASSMAWINERVPVILSGLPLTSGGRKYSLALLQLAERATDEKAKAELAAAGRPSTEQFAQAMAGSSLPHLESLSTDVTACLVQLAQLEQAVDARFVMPVVSGTTSRPTAMLSFGAVRKVLVECQFQLERALRAKGAREAKKAPGTGPVSSETVGDSDTSPATGDSVWDRALQLVLHGQLEGLRLAQEHIEVAASGRDRFLRQLQLSELCVQIGMHAFAYPILDDLGKVIDQRDLVTWEDADVIRRAWSSLAAVCTPLSRIRPESVARQAEAQQRLQALVGSVDGGEQPAGS